MRLGLWMIWIVAKEAFLIFFVRLMWLAEKKYLIAYEFRFGFHTFLVCECFLCSLWKCEVCVTLSWLGRWKFIRPVWHKS
jgi:hypothetical protein